MYNLLLISYKFEFIMKINKEENMHPWRAIWTQPRATIQSLILKDPNYGLKRLAWIYGFTTALSFSKMHSLITLYPLWTVVLGSLLLGIVIGLVFISITAYILQWSGRLIGGNAPFKQVRCVVAWSNAPVLINVVIWFLLICAFREQTFYVDFPVEIIWTNKTGLFLLAILGNLIAVIWSFIILIQGLREVQGFSFWKGLLNIIIPLIALAILSILIKAVVEWFITKI
jgi:hypothetical protein